MPERLRSFGKALWKINNDLAASAQRQDKEGKERFAALNTAADAYKYIRDNMSSSSAMPWVLFQLGNIYYSLNNYDEAIARIMISWINIAVIRLRLLRNSLWDMPMRRKDF